MSNDDFKRCETIAFDLKILLGNILISLVKNICATDDDVKFAEFLLNRYSKNVSSIQLDEILISVCTMSFFISSHSTDSLKDKLLALGANKNLLLINPYSLGMSKFMREYGSKISYKYYSRAVSNQIVVKSILAELGKPIENLRNVIHITGSNGKGSTGAFLHSILEANGYTVNRYYKPYIIRVNEEIVIHGKEIEDDYLYDVYKRIMESFGRIKETEDFKKKIDGADSFDRIKEVSKTVINLAQMKVISSMLAFYENPADYNIIEVRAGGWKDITNIFSEEQTVATVLTNMQHNAGNNNYSLWITNEKGETEFSNRAVAYQKAMLGKKDVPMIVANQSEDVLKEIRRVAAEEVKTDTVEYNRDWFIKDETEDAFVFEGYGYRMKLNKSKTLFEKFQTYNTATAIATFLSVIKDKSKISQELIQKGIDNAGIIGRPQRITSGRYAEYFGNNKNIEIISSIVKPVIGGVDSIESILKSDSKKDFFNYFIFSAGNRHIVDGYHITYVTYLFDVLTNKDVVGNSQLVVYKLREESFELIKSVLDKKDVKFITENNLSSSLEFVKMDIKKNKKIHKKNRVFILSTPTCGDADRNVIFLNC